MLFTCKDSKLCGRLTSHGDAGTLGYIRLARNNERHVLARCDPSQLIPGSKKMDNKPILQAVKVRDMEQVLSSNRPDILFRIFVDEVGQRQFPSASDDAKYRIFRCCVGGYVMSRFHC